MAHRQTPFPFIGLPAWIVSLFLLAGVAGEAWSRPGERDARNFHARVRQAVASIPRDFGSWTGTDEPLPPDVSRMLAPNALCSRLYVQRETGWTMQLLMIQCRDARQMTGHFPTICFATNGWSQLRQTDGQLEVAGWTIPIREYLFTRGEGNDAARLAVIHFVALPDGRYGRDLQTIWHAAASLTRRAFGAAQIELAFSAAQPPAQRRAAACAFLAANKPLLAALAAPSIGN